MANLAYQHLGQQYYDAAVRLLEAIQHGDADDSQLAHPVLYLYRHSVELFLKAALGRAAKSHDLAELATQFKARLKAKLNAELPAWITNRIAELAAIDPSSTAFRYSETWDKAAKTHVPLEGELHVDAAHLKDAMSALNTALGDFIHALARAEDRSPQAVSSRAVAPAFTRYIGIDYSGAETPRSPAHSRGR